jgi:hypothetical protein
VKRDPRFPGNTPCMVIFLDSFTGKRPKHVLHVVNPGFYDLNGDEQTNTNESPWLTREQALANVARDNAYQQQTAGLYYSWCMAVELGVNPKWFANVTLSNGSLVGEMDLHDIPFRIVKPTRDERRRYANYRLETEEAV